MPCQNSMENMPATLKTSEKARKYHFFPRKSMFVLRKNSTEYYPLSDLWFRSLNAQRLTAFFPAQDPVEDHARNEYGGEQVGQQTEGEGHGKPFDRAGSEQEQNRRRDDRGHVGIDDRNPGMTETLIHGRRRRLSVTQFFPNALENQHIRVHAHADGENHSRDPGQGQHGVEVAHEAEQDDEVQQERDIGVDSSRAIVDQHEDQDGKHADNRRPNPGADRIGAERRPHGALFEILDACRQSTGAQDHGQVLGLLLVHAAPADFTGIADGLFDIGNFLNFVVEHYGQTIAHVRRGEVVEPLPPLARQLEADIGLTILIGARLGIPQVFPAVGGNPRDQIPSLVAGGSSGGAVAGKQNRIWWQDSTLILPRGVFARIGPTHHLLDLEHGGGLHDVFHPGRVVDAAQLHQNLVLAETVLLDRGFTHAQRIDAVVDGFNRLRHRLALQIREDLRLHGQRPGVVRPRSQVVFRQAGVRDVEQVFG